MDQKPKFIGTDEAGSEYEIEYPELLYTVPFTPMLDRIEEEKPELIGGFHMIFKEVGPEIFQNYFNQLIDIKKAEHRMIITTKNYRHKSFLEKFYLPLICEAFQVTNIRIISQG
ncbi:MAG: hypothetical protein PHX92_02535 [Candidatus Pacebacteria bacterium]|jgi:hypothetical protein|nr:hypothetical protein [Candidatus Paceibacterota bacterium]